MAEYVLERLVIDDLSKGLNGSDPVTRVPKGFYVDCLNMLLTNKVPQTTGGLTKLTATPAPDDGIITWAEPYTSGAETSLVVTTDQGNVFKYAPSTDTWTTLLIGLTAGALVWTHVPFRGQLVFTNGVDPIQKYDGHNALPVGSLFVCDMDTDEAWAGTFIRPPSTNLNLRRVSLSSIRIRSSKSATITFASPPKDFITGINGAPDFVATDNFRIWVYRAPKTPSGTITITFKDNTTPTTKHFDVTTTITHLGWSELTILRSAFVNTGSAVWTNIGSMKIAVNSGSYFIFDRASFQYIARPPIANLVELYNQQLVAGGIATDLVSIQYSDPGTIDYFPAENSARFSGGRHAFEKTDQVTALRSYFDELIVGKVNSAWTFSGTGINVSISALPLTIGIDGHRVIAETPWSLQYPFENNIFGARLTSRGLVSNNINNLLNSLDGNNLDRGVVIRHDRTRTLRWSFRTTAAADAQNDLGLIYDYSADAWCCRYSPRVSYYTRGIVDGNREVLVVQYDGYVRRADVGVDFDGTPIESYVTLPYMQTSTEASMDKVTRWYDTTVYLKGTATVMVDARFADEPHQFDSAVFQTFGTVQATPNSDKGTIPLGRTARWIQLRLRATSGAFEVLLPLVIGYTNTQRRI
jgi:hypothetical protein